ncbi:hypothetical protein AB0395_07260 [Streptosporangium sp. NPDC051023]|uniref:hypothetical protein n=1 Tax=Streptosporangium sp. NPDC051023 TaxID=3155410 RepID=UPI00345094EE
MVLTAIVLLIAGFVLAKPFLVMWSIAVSVLSAVFLVIGALLRRHELFPGGGRGGAVPPLPPKGTVPPGPPVPNQPVLQAPLPTTVPHGVAQTASVASQPRLGRPVAGPPTAARRGPLDDEAIVLVIPGRKRYHVEGCRQLAGRDHEELTHEEAREEGFTPCTTCLPEFTAGIQQDAPQGSKEPASPSSQGPGPSRSGDAREAGVHESTARFTSPYGPAAASGVHDTPVTRPYVQGPSALAEQQARRGPEQSPAGRQEGPERSPADGQSGEPRESGQPSVREQSAPPLRAAEPAAFPVRSPAPISETPADPNATSWFSRDMVRPLMSEAAPAEQPETGQSETGAGPARTGNAKTASAGTEPESSADERETAGAATPKTAPGGPDKAPSSAAATGGDVPSGAGNAPAKAASRNETTPGESGEAPPSPVKQGSSAASAETAEPVEPTGTGPGRAGRPGSAGSTTAAPAAEGTGENTPAAPGEGTGPAAGRPREAAAPEMVKIISGTRRFHSPSCPLIKGLDAIKNVQGSGLETIPLTEAEEAGMRSCSVCRPVAG